MKNMIIKIEAQFIMPETITTKLTRRLRKYPERGECRRHRIHRYPNQLTFWSGLFDVVDSADAPPGSSRTPPESSRAPPESIRAQQGDDAASSGADAVPKNLIALH
jgi:hypothetical protein